MIQSRKRLLGVLAGALCIVVGLASIAFAKGGLHSVVTGGLGMESRAPKDTGGKGIRAGKETMDCQGSMATMSVERLEAAIARMTVNRERLAKQIEEFEAKIPERESKIADIEDETLREFAARRSEILKQRHRLSQEHLSIIEQKLHLLQDALAYAKSR